MFETTTKELLAPATCDLKLQAQNYESNIEDNKKTLAAQYLHNSKTHRRNNIITII